MNKAILTTNFGEDLLRHTVRIEADPSDDADFRALVEFLRTIVNDQPDLLRHMAPCPIGLTLNHDNGRWVLESTCIIPRPPDRE